MPIIAHTDVRLSPTTERVREREGRMHTHPIDVSIQVLSGAIQIILGDEVRTVRAGTTLLAPPGVPHKMIHHLWTPALLLITYPSSELETDHLE